MYCFVSDNGIGIAPEYRDRVFNLFERLETNTRGSDVGLAIVKRIIESLGGEIWIESEGPSSGTRFEFTLPAKAFTETGLDPAKASEIRRYVAKFLCYAQ